MVETRNLVTNNHLSHDGYLNLSKILREQQSVTHRVQRHIAGSIFSITQLCANLAVLLTSCVADIAPCVG